MRKGIFSALFAFIGMTLFMGQIYSADWPMWRFDAGRRGMTDMELTEAPGLLWTRQLPDPERCWPFQYEDYFTGGNPMNRGKLSFDISYEPVVGNGKLYVPSMVSDKVTAYSTENGQEVWRFYAGGPVRFAPVYWEDKLYFTSDDGYLYCLDADEGELLWKLKGSYSSRQVLGNERLISMWPGRGGPVIRDGIIYFASGVVAFEGVFVHAVDAESGEIIWTNSTSGSMWDLHQHGGAYSYGGPAPQGYLAVTEDKLLVPGGRTPPAVFNRETGELLYFRQATEMVGKGAGGYQVFVHGDWFFNHNMLYSLEDGAQYGAVSASVITDESYIGVRNGLLQSYSLYLEKEEIEIANRLSRGAIRELYETVKLWDSSIDQIEDLYVKVGHRLAVSRGNGDVALIDLSEEGIPEKISWEYTVDGEVWNILAADEKLFVITKDGKIYCFGEDKGVTPVHYQEEKADIKPGVKYTAWADKIIAETGVTAGYAMVLGGGNSELTKALVDNTDLHIVVVEDNPGKVRALRRRFDERGDYGRRIAVIQDDPLTYPFPPYLAELVIMTEGPSSTAHIEKAYAMLRPYGGTLYVHGDVGETDNLYRRVRPQNGELKKHDDFSLIVREGPLPGAGQWTHQYGNASNRTYSDDSLVKAPLGVLWFGGPSNINTLPRHHNGPIPQVAGGRLFILGIDTLSARCVYTGRELWVKDFPEIGHPFTSIEHEKRFRDGQEVYMPNHPGANFIGSPYVSVSDAVYVIYQDKLYNLDPATGEVNVEFRIPPLPDLRTREWGHVMVWEDYLIATIDPQIFDDGEIGKVNNWNATSSSIILVMNRHEGSIYWAKKADRIGFRHNAITAGEGKLFVIDGLSPGARELLQRRGVEVEDDSVLLAFDIENGRELWRKDEDVFGTWLGYYEEYDILIQGGRHGARGVPPDEPRDRMNAHQGQSGEKIWEYRERYTGPVGLHPDRIIPGSPGQRAVNPQTGNVVLNEHPLTGEEYRWSYHRYYGCGTMNSSRYLLMFRSGAAGFHDLYNMGGTGNLGGFRSGCTSSLVAADGLLNSPDYTRTCTCSYQLQTSVGLVHMPEVEMWTLNRLERGSAPIRTLGINFGAQGNRRENNVLWLEYPKIYAQGPDIPLEITSGSHEWFRNHASWIQNPEAGHAWVGSYGAKGIESLTVQLVPEDADESKLYQVTLIFAEPDGKNPGERLFDVRLQGETVLSDFDVAREAGGPRRVVKKVFSDVYVDDVLEVAFSGGTTPPVISGIEIICQDYMGGIDEGNWQ